MKHTPRQPSWFYQRRTSASPTTKQRIHALLRQNPTQTSEQLAYAAHCSHAYARIWKHKFFAANTKSSVPSLH